MLSSKTKLCIKVLVAVAAAPSGRSVTVQALSDRLHVSVSHLESITRILREAEFVRAARGPGGGYQMACDATALSIWDVVQRVDQTVQAPPVAAGSGSPIASLEMAIHQTFVDFLGSRRLADFADPEGWPQAVPVPSASGFRLRPLPRRARPLAPNSVFELSAFPLARAA